MVSGVIIAGGKNSRMGGQAKALLRVNGERLIDRTVRLLNTTCAEVVVVTNSPRDYLYLDCLLVGDIYSDKGPLGGIHSGLFYASHIRCFVVACDMPFLHEGLIHHLIARSAECDIVVPLWGAEYQPLHAVYSKKCLERIEQLLRDDRLKVTGFYSGHRLRTVSEREITALGATAKVFANINFPEDAEKLADIG